MMFVFARFVAKAGANYVVSRYCAVYETKQSALLGFTMLPMAGLAIGIVNQIAEMYPEFGAEFGTIVLAAVEILETLGPIATEFALKRTGEVPTDAKVEH